MHFSRKEDDPVFLPTLPNLLSTAFPADLGSDFHPSLNRPSSRWSFLSALRDVPSGWGSIAARPE